ncbi:UDP-N-acetylglucosamine 2-epimerase (non-hydrolyzing) [Cytophagaceae bacterium 50C-KIRBA]|uniref:UDP-N-acetylglucosamine 2-epimerase (Non-hydrolyzing) n=1 Tax=Aquirufa beregesia TaxID=2516556 RepID=A0ABX0F021_9BACT|nr:UDP-N-acetylglucosamine 2-epimerase (non-hydrolyzing) [Aquirufa beregesia]NGZ45222.1 UDP-N-acetylglucosamine 2-epimerase (non-hydrolyzing) [Aquirufa beregesia]
MKVLQIVGARPNFMKVAPLHRAIQQMEGWESKIVHTGQHFDAKMSDVFFTQLELPKPDFFLGIGGGTQSEVTAKIMLAFEPIVQAEKPDLIIVVGDVTSTLACTLVAIKMDIPIAHVEAGLRSGDRKMPEEINRILTDSVANYLFVTEESGMQHLKHEGVAPEKVFFVGNVMIDSLERYREKAKQSTIMVDLQVQPKQFIVVTMHRPANVDTEQGLHSILELLELSTSQTKVVFPIHPRTRAHIDKFQLTNRLNQIPNLILTEPLGYLEFIQLMSNASAILTDSGGIQEETTYLGIPCLTFRDSTERPITVTLGTNQLLADLDPKKTYAALLAILNGEVKKGEVPPLWDGNTADRIAAIIHQLFPHS